MAQTVEELLEEIAKMKAAQEAHEKRLLDRISELKEEVSDLKTNIVPKLEQKLTDIQDKQRIFVEHINQLYNAQTIEQTIAAMSAVSMSELGAAECDVYSIDAAKHQMFTIDENGDRQYIDMEDNSYIERAIRFGEVTINNDLSAEVVGDGKPTMNIKNIAVIPIESEDGSILAVVAAKNKETDFTKEDAAAFDLVDGKIGSAFRVGFENKHLKQLAITDKLTSLHNREGCDEYMKNEVYAAIQNNEPVSAIIMDIDNFKSFNDAFGHDVGDRALQHVADIVKDNVRPCDEVARWGGEEIVVVVKGDEAEAYKTAEQIRKSISETPLYISDDNSSVKVTVSMGTAELDPRDFMTTVKSNMLSRFEATALKVADERLYEAKKEGKNQVVASPSVVPYDRSDYDVVTFERTYDLQDINSPLLVSDNTRLAGITTHSLESGLTATVDLVVEGTPEIYFNEEFFNDPEKYTPELKAAIQNNEWGTMQVVSENHISAKIEITNSDGELVKSSEDILEDIDFSRMTSNEIREFVFEKSVSSIREMEEMQKTTAKQRNTQNLEKE